MLLFRSKKSLEVSLVVPSVAKSGSRTTTPSSSWPPPKLSVSPTTSIDRAQRLLQ
uniref:Uncharacterized protein n=1 Tax=Nelumbo nucifera TaxID=4432 RepID=A0A822Z1S0_NELNU|nr:TPA_asm: hypothetical protein HUJ06_013039 [Nelumbo nucifera]